MSKICKVTINDEPFLANRGELLLDWALMNGVDLPHVALGSAAPAAYASSMVGIRRPQPRRRMIHACQAGIVSDLEIAIRPRPAGGVVGGSGANRSARADMVGVDINCRSRSTTFPASIASCSFGDFLHGPTPTFRWKALSRSPAALPHPEGCWVSSALGRSPCRHRVKLMGPLAAPFSGKAIPGASCWSPAAPVSLTWSVAVTAIMGQPQREMVFIVQARSIRSLYMHAALCRLALFPNP
jgi:3-phenylpropionate/trans-cinnamate dioxygenase ferredoxin reductase subunit